MANRTETPMHVYGIITIAMIAAIAVFHFYSNHQAYVKGKNAPLSAEVKEQLAQARTLQKQGAFEDSASLFEQYAILGYPDAMFYLARAYSRGWGVKPDLDKARWYLLSAVEYDFSYRGETAYELGRLYQKSAGPDCNTIAVAWFKKSLNWNYHKASVALATHYEKGLGVQQDLEQAITYYELATQNGNAMAALKHARIISSGKFGIPENPEYAERLMKFAVIQLESDANRGKASAAKTLGRLYRDGGLVQVDNDKALHWLRLSSDLGNRGAMHDLGHLLLAIDDTKYAHEAIALFESAADDGHGGAATTLGRMHLKQKHDLPLEGAVRWFEKGVDAGHSGSMKELAVIYHDGKLIPQDLNRAIELLQAGANKGHSGSKRLLNQYLKKRQKRLASKGKTEKKQSQNV